MAVSASTFEQDSTAALKFLDHVFPPDYDGYIYGCATTERDGILNNAIWGHTSELETFVEEAFSYRGNIYVSPALLHQCTTPRGHLKNEDVLALNHFKVELDSKEAAMKFSSLTQKCQPSIKVTTGTLPWHRIHAYWCFKDPMTDITTYRSIQSQFAARFGGDCIPDPRRLMRLPGAINRPKNAKLQLGYVDELITVEIL